MGVYSTVFALLICSFSFCLPQKSYAQKGDELIFWDVGQGDLFTFVGLTTCVFFDVGGNQGLSKFFTSYIKDNCYLKENHLFISHYDYDHILHYKKIHSLVFFTNIYVPHVNPKTKTAINLISFFKNKNVNIHIVNNTTVFMFNKLKIKNIPHKTDFTENSKSLVLQLELKGKKILLTGDLAIKHEPNDLDKVDLLKIAHHGSKYSTSEKLLKKIKPKMCVISVGNNKYGHPHLDVIKKLRKYNCAVLETKKVGSVKLNF